MCRRRQTGRSGRDGYTLLEVMLALAVAVLLLAGLYTAMRVQLHHSQSGREVAEQALLHRALLNRIRQDIVATVNLPDSSRGRVQQQKQNSGGGQGGSAQGGASGTTGNTGGAGPSNAGGATSGTGTGTGTSTDASSSTGATTTVSWTYGVVGDNATLNLFVSKLPREVLGQQAQQADPNATVVNDLRRVSYWMADGGLARQEVKVSTAQELTTLPPDVTDDGTIKYTPEVKNIQFTYFDGSSWQDSWDSTQLGADGATVIGPPRLIAIRIDIEQPTPGGGTRVKSYRHVVPIATANGATQMQQPTGGTTSGGGS